MAQYRLYPIKEDGHFFGPPLVIEASGDDAAVREAKALLGDRAVEIWQRARKVALLVP
jgi:hypothetical protein